MAADPSNNPLNKFVSAGETQQNFRVPALPSIADLVAAHGLMEGLRIFDQTHTEWRQQLERAINTQLKPAPTLPSGTIV